MLLFEGGTVSFESGRTTGRFYKLVNRWVQIKSETFQHIADSVKNKIAAEVSALRWYMSFTSK